VTDKKVNSSCLRWCEMIRLGGASVAVPGN